MFYRAGMINPLASRSHEKKNLICQGLKHRLVCVTSDAELAPKVFIDISTNHTSTVFTNKNKCISPIIL